MPYSCNKSHIILLVSFLTLPRRAVVDDLLAPGEYGQDGNHEGMFNLAENTPFHKFDTRIKF